MLLQRFSLGTLLVSLVLVACSDGDGNRTIGPSFGQGVSLDTSGRGPGLRRDDRSGATPIIWGPAPPIFPPGAQFAVVEGDPGAAGEIFTVRLRFPNGYVLPPHTHPADEYVTVLQGTFLAGMGEDFSRAALIAYKEDDFATMPGNMAHFAAIRGTTEVQVHGMGPFALTYVHPEDDPRNK
jgi:quercetin dioxygenase-like cupin family protein